MTRPGSCWIAATLWLAGCGGRPAPGTPAPALDSAIDIFAMQPTSFGFVFRASLPHRGYPVVLGFTPDGLPRLLTAGGRRPRPLQAGLQDLWADVASETALPRREAPSLFGASTSNPQCATELTDGRCLAGAVALGPQDRVFVILLFDTPVDRMRIDSMLASRASPSASPEGAAVELRKLLGATASGVWRS